MSDGNQEVLEGIERDITEARWPANLLILHVTIQGLVEVFDDTLSVVESARAYLAREGHEIIETEHFERIQNGLREAEGRLDRIASAAATGLAAVKQAQERARALRTSEG